MARSAFERAQLRTSLASAPASRRRAMNAIRKSVLYLPGSALLRECFEETSMNRLCHRFAIGTMLTAFAAIAVAAPPKKSYNLEFLLPDNDELQATSPTNPAYDSTTGQLIPPVAVTVTVKNESPPSTANSNISSFQFTVSGLALLNGSGDIACPNARCSVDPSTGTVYVT
ncbi:MAG TPA: hypothetical protein VFO53_01285, partial [Casimicrobiaceae bacterium]|nr:hypothetical protein [Casimicrobiaceae bacterium]